MPAAAPRRPAVRKGRQRAGVAALLAGLLVAWVLVDVYGHASADLRGFDAEQAAHLETESWRAYYDGKPLRLYWLLISTLRQEYHRPFWRATGPAWHAARATIVFKEGHDRVDYERAMPELERYFATLCRIGRCGAETRRLARLELDWWVAHREPEDEGGASLTDAVAAAAAALYGTDPEAVRPYAEARVAAMLQRDRAAESGGLAETDWDEIEAMLRDAYRALAEGVRR